MTKRKFTLSDEDLISISNASKPRLLSLSDQRTSQEVANMAWAMIGLKYGFDYTTVEADPTTKDKGVIFAEPLIQGGTIT